MGEIALGIGVILAALAASGLTYLVTSGGEGGLVSSLEDQIEDWLEDTGRVVDFPTPASFFENMGGGGQDDGPRFRNGKVLITAAAFHLIVNFMDWLINKHEIVEGGSSVAITNQRSFPLLNGSSWVLTETSSDVGANSSYISGVITSVGSSIPISSTVGLTYDVFQLANGNKLRVAVEQGSSSSLRDIRIYGSDASGQSIPLTSYLSSFYASSFDKGVYVGYSTTRQKLFIGFGNPSVGNSMSLVVVSQSNSNVFLAGTTIGEIYVSAVLSSTISPVEPETGDDVELTVVLENPPLDLDAWGEAVVDAAVSGDLEVEAAVQPGEEVLEYPDTILGWLQWIWEALSHTRLTNIIQEIKSLPQRIAEAFQSWFTSIITWLGNLPGTLTNLFNDLKTAIQALPQSIANAFRNAFELDPELATEIGDAFTEKFEWFDPLYDWFEDVTSIEPTPPVIYINLQNANSPYGFVYGGQRIALDLSWYSRYKSDVDSLMSGFLWLGFLWLLFKRASAIIQGAEMVDRMQEDLSAGEIDRRRGRR